MTVCATQQDLGIRLWPRRRTQPHAGRRPLAQHLPAEAEQFGRPAPGRGGTCRCLPPALFRHQAAEILLVQAKPASASTARCSSSRVKVGAISSNTTGRYFSLPRSRAMAVARMRRWSNSMGVPQALSAVRKFSPALRIRPARLSASQKQTFLHRRSPAASYQSSSYTVVKAPALQLAISSSPPSSRKPPTRDAGSRRCVAVAGRTYPAQRVLPPR